MTTDITINVAQGDRRVNVHRKVRPQAFGFTTREPSEPGEVFTDMCTEVRETMGRDE